MFLIISCCGLNIFFQASTSLGFYPKDNRTLRAPSLTWLRGNTRTGNLTGSRFASPCDDGSPRREIELGAQQYPRKWTSERIKSPCWLSHGRRNFIMEPANFGGSCAKFAARKRKPGQGDDSSRRNCLTRLKCRRRMGSWKFLSSESRKFSCESKFESFYRNVFY